MGDLSAAEIVGLLIESIEEKNEHFGRVKERSDKTLFAETKKLQMQIEEKDRAIIKALESRNIYSQQLQEMTTKHIEQKENAEMWTSKFVKAMKLAEEMLTKPKFEQFKEIMEKE